MSIKGQASAGGPVLWPSQQTRGATTLASTTRVEVPRCACNVQVGVRVALVTSAVKRACS